MSSGIEFNEKDVLRVFSQLDVSSMHKIHKAALRKSIKVLVTEAQLKLQGVTTRASSTRTADRRGWSSNSSRRTTSLKEGVRYYVAKNDDFAKAHLLGDFRLKFFEMGTDRRETRKGYNRGKMFKASNNRKFFSPAVNAALPKMSATLRKSIVDAVTKVAKQ